MSAPRRGAPTPFLVCVRGVRSSAQVFVVIQWAADQGAVSPASPALTIGTSLEGAAMADDQHTRPLSRDTQLADESDVPNWHTLRSLGGIMGELLRDLELRSRAGD